MITPFYYEEMIDIKKLKRVNEIKIRLDDDELDNLNQAVALSGMSREAYLRSLINLELPRGKPTEEYLEVIRQLKMIGNNINQLAMIANKTGSIDSMKLKAETGKLSIQIMEIKTIASQPIKIGEIRNGNN